MKYDADRVMSAGPHVVRETLLAKLYGLGTVILQGVLPDGSIAILSDGLSYLLGTALDLDDLSWSEAVVWQQQNELVRSKSFGMLVPHCYFVRGTSVAVLAPTVMLLVLPYPQS